MTNYNPRNIFGIAAPAQAPAYQDLSSSSNKASGYDPSNIFGLVPPPAPYKRPSTIYTPLYSFPARSADQPRTRVPPLSNPYNYLYHMTKPPRPDRMERIEAFARDRDVRLLDEEIARRKEYDRQLYLQELQAQYGDYYYYDEDDDDDDDDDVVEQVVVLVKEKEAGSMHMYWVALCAIFAACWTALNARCEEMGAWLGSRFADISWRLRMRWACFWGHPIFFLARWTLGEAVKWMLILGVVGVYVMLCCGAEHLAEERQVHVWRRGEYGGTKVEPVRYSVERNGEWRRLGEDWTTTKTTTTRMTTMATSMPAIVRRAVEKEQQHMKRHKESEDDLNYCQKCKQLHYGEYWTEGDGWKGGIYEQV